MEKSKIATEKKSLPSTTPQEGRLAVVMIAGKQYLLREGDVLTVENLGEDIGQKLGGFNVLLYGDGGHYSFGTPVIQGAKVEAEVLGNFKGKKIDVIKFKAKSRYSKKIGYRSQLTKIKILKIQGGHSGS